MLFSVNFDHPQLFCICRGSSVFPVTLPPGSYVFRRQGHPVNPDLDDWLVLVSSQCQEFKIPDECIVGISYETAMSLSIFDWQFPELHIKLQEIAEMQPVLNTADELAVEQLIADTQRPEPVSQTRGMHRTKIVTRTTFASNPTPRRRHTHRHNDTRLRVTTLPRYHPACRRTC